MEVLIHVCVYQEGIGREGKKGGNAVGELFIQEPVQENASAGIALHKLASLHEALGQTSEAAHYYQQNLTRVDASRCSHIALPLTWLCCD